MRKEAAEQTVRTLEFAQPTLKMQLTDVMNLDTGEPIKLPEFLMRELSLVIQDRNKLASRFVTNPNEPWLVCQLCSSPLLLVRTQERCFHFRHHPSIESETGCSISTKGKLSPDQINRIKYNAQKESHAHIRLKGIIRDSLRVDKSCSAPQVEKVWKGLRVADRATWRKPDVQVERAGQRIAFEVQLSTTYLTEIVGRREFYRVNSGAMIWVFQSFDPTQTRTAEEDIFYLNNHNVFIVSNATLERSEASGRMALDCWFARPRMINGQIENEWCIEPVFLDQLTIQQDLQLVYFFDYQAERDALKSSSSLDSMRQEFHEFWLEFGAEESRDADVAWTELRERMINVLPDLELPRSYWQGPFHGAVSIMLSARYGRPVGYRHDRLLNVTNTAFEYYKPFLLPFGWTLRDFGWNETLDQQDKKGTWAKRRAEIRAGVRAKDKAYQPDGQFNQLFAFLIPEIRENLMKMQLW